MSTTYDRDIMQPYKKLNDSELQYGYCRDFNHISRYKGLRQMSHNVNNQDEVFTTLEIQNPFETQSEIFYHVVTVDEENRLDLLAHRYLGSPTYSWVIALFNQIEDGFTAHAGTHLKIPKQFTSLFNKGEILSPVSPFSLNVGIE